MQNDGDKKGVLVVGAGLTGIQTALELAESGHLVYLVEQAPHIGGKMAQSREGAHSSLLTERIEAVRRHPNIRIVTHASVERVKGEAVNFEVTVRREPLRVTEKCTDCGKCVQVCPIKPLSREECSTWAFRSIAFPETSFWKRSMTSSGWAWRCG